MNKTQSPKKKRWLRWLNIALVIYLLCGVSLYLLQDRFLFHPEILSRETKYAFAFPHREINIALDEKYNINVVQFLTKDSLSKGVVLYFHGNMKNIARYAGNASDFTGNGYEVWMIDYPGFGKSTGKLTEQKLYEFASQLYIMARSKYAADSIIIYGKSLGSGIAAWLASKKSCKQLILEAPYYSMTSLVASYIPIYPAGTLIKYKLPTYKYLNVINAPVTIFHGTSDKVIPYSNAYRLTTAMQTKDKFITVENAGHNNLNEFPLFKNSLDSLLKN